MKNRILCWVTWFLLYSVPQNQASKLLDSLFCFLQYSPPTSEVICSWSENLNSRKLVNISLINVDDKYPCQKIEETNRFETQVTRSCHIAFHKIWTKNIIITFKSNKSLESRLNVSDKSEAKPQNLHCDNDGKLAKCYWKLRMEVAEYFDFKLFYAEKDGTESTCEPSCQLDIHYLSCNCTIAIKDHLDPSAVLSTIRVGPENNTNSTKVFRPCSNITLPPRKFMINEKKKGEAFTINLFDQEDTEDEYFKDHYFYELCYWEQNDLKSNEVSNDCPGQIDEYSNKHEKIANLQLRNQLKPSLTYAVKIRVRLIDNRTDPCFNGPWSEWSEVKSLQTKAASNIKFLIYIMVPVCVIFVVICGLCGCKALIRYKNQWDDRIPNPSKSSIVKGFQKKKDWLVMRYLNLQNGRSFPAEEHLYVEPYNKILCTSSSNVSYNLKNDQDCVSIEDQEEILNDETQCFYFPDLNEEAYPTATVVDGYKALSEMINEQERTNQNPSEFTFSAFDGPYLFSEHT